ncbi:MAG: LysM peptidoglycan-binding domain-containing protein [Gemmatimonadetes bacterium]|nr:LysM peptidoglycan-binding domain-containing protein [Gemmatimonadota bacterium]
MEDQIAVRLATFRRDATAASTATAPERTAGNGSLVHVHEVRRGDTLTAIGRRYGVTLRALLSANPGINARRLLVGQRIRIPATT